MTYNTKKLAEDRGVVSLLVTMILMIVISLIVLGFALVSNNEQKGSLNRQLSEEAYYAADSGINYATAIIDQDLANPPSQPGCTGPYSMSNALGNAAYGVSYPCLTVDPAPYQIQYTITTGQPKIIPVDAQSGSISSIDFQWYEDLSSKTYVGCKAPTGSLLPTAVLTNPGCDASVLQVDIIPINANLLNAASVIYLYPIYTGASANNSASLSAAPSTKLYPVVCYPDGTACNFTLNGLNATEYYLRILPIYATKTDLTLSATNASGVGVGLKGAQVDIHSTGKAQDVLQGLEATVDISGTNTGTAPFAIQSNQSICADQEVGGPSPASVGNSNCSSIEQN